MAANNKKKTEDAVRSMGGQTKERIHLPERPGEPFDLIVRRELSPMPAGAMLSSTATLEDGVGHQLGIAIDGLGFGKPVQRAMLALHRDSGPLDIAVYNGEVSVFFTDEKEARQFLPLLTWASNELRNLLRLRDLGWKGGPR